MNVLHAAHSFESVRVVHFVHDQYNWFASHRILALFSIRDTLFAQQSREIFIALHRIGSVIY